MAQDFPSDPTDGWEPGPPSLRGMGPSVLGGAVLPLVTYYAVRHAVSSDAVALAIAGIPAALWVLVSWIRTRSIDPIGAITLFGFAAGLLASWALGGSDFVLKVRDSVFTGLLGLACLWSVFLSRRPIMFVLGKEMSAGQDAARRKLYDQLWEMPPAQAVFRIITAVWAVVLLTEAVARVVLALVLPTGPFLAASPVLAFVAFGGAGAFTVWFSGWARGRLEGVDWPEDGGSAWWWFRRLFDAPPAAPSVDGVLAE